MRSISFVAKTLLCIFVLTRGFLYLCIHLCYFITVLNLEHFQQSAISLGRHKGKNIRKRTSVEEGEEGYEDSRIEKSVLFNKKKQIVSDNKLHFSSGPTKRSLTSEDEVEKKKCNGF